MHRCVKLPLEARGWRSLALKNSPSWVAEYLSPESICWSRINSFSSRNLMQESISVVDSMATESKVHDAYFSTCSGVLEMDKYIKFWELLLLTQIIFSSIYCMKINQNRAAIYTFWQNWKIAKMALLNLSVKFKNFFGQKHSFEALWKWQQEKIFTTCPRVRQIQDLCRKKYKKGIF